MDNLDWISEGDAAALVGRKRSMVEKNMDLLRCLYNYHVNPEVSVKTIETVIGLSTLKQCNRELKTMSSHSGAVVTDLNEKRKCRTDDERTKIKELLTSYVNNRQETRGPKFIKYCKRSRSSSYNHRIRAR